MKKESEIIISNLTEEEAIKLLPELKREVGRGPKFTLDTPEPEQVWFCEKEYEKVETALGNLYEHLDNALGGIGDAEKRSEVLRDIFVAKKDLEKTKKLVAAWEVAIGKLESAANRLPEK